MKLALTVITTFLYFGVAAQAENAIRLRNFNLTDYGVAIRDFDPVSYFNGRALKGNEKFSHTYKGITYYFANAANLETFKKAPGKYEPAYGGWCAYGMAQNGQRVKVDPTTFKIINGKVFLFSNFNGQNKLLAWNKDEKKLKASADQFWLRKIR